MARSATNVEPGHIYSGKLRNACISCANNIRDPRTACEYQPLLTGQIRVIDIHPAKDTFDPICCDLRPRARAGRRYMTLSHAWGETFADGSHLTDEITCSGRRMKVTSALNQALKRIRQHQTRFRNRRKDLSIDVDPLWVDAICINQRDLIECGHMVNMMGEIFAHSSRLLVSLGEMSDAELSQLPQLDLQDHTSLARMLTRHPGPSETFVKSLLNRSWFQRRWIVQEWLLTPEAGRYFFIGGQIFNASQLRHSIYWTNANRPYLLRTDTKKGQSLLRVLHDYDGHKCHLAHDRVYALLHIPGIMEIEVDADYTVPAAEVYTRMATQIFNSDSIKVLGAREHMLAAATCHRSEAFTLSPDLPSWVPDWRNSIQYRSNEHEAAVEETLPWATSFPNDFRREYETGEGFVNGNTLHLRGRLEQPCFPPEHDVSERRCFCCYALRVFWHEWEDWHDLQEESDWEKHDGDILGEDTAFSCGPHDAVLRDRKLHRGGRAWSDKHKSILCSGGSQQRLLWLKSSGELTFSGFVCVLDPVGPNDTTDVVCPAYRLNYCFFARFPRALDPHQRYDYHNLMSEHLKYDVNKLTWEKNGTEDGCEMVRIV